MKVHWGTMRKIDQSTLIEMAGNLAAEDRDEMAIPSYTHNNPLLRWMAWKRLAVIAKLIDRHTPQGGCVLDYGCGTGVLFETALQKAISVVGVDLVLTAAQLWKERQKLDSVRLLHPQDAFKSIGSQSVDVVVAAEVLEHIDDPTEVLDFFKRVLRPQGKLLVSLPTENALYKFGRKLAGFSGHYHKSNAASVTQHIQSAGWLLDWQKHIPLPQPAAIYFVGVFSVR